jgi:hypothetical protein
MNAEELDAPELPADEPSQPRSSVRKRGSGRCEHCHGAPERAARTRALPSVSREMYYLGYLWRCSVCGHEWEDEELRELNLDLARRARAIAAED